MPCVLYATGVSSVLIKGSANLLSFLTTRQWKIVPLLYDGGVFNFTYFWCAVFLNQMSEYISIAVPNTRPMPNGDMGLMCKINTL